MKTKLLNLLITLSLLISCSNDDIKNDPVKKEKVAVSFSYDSNAILFDATNNNTESITIYIMISYFENKSIEYPYNRQNAFGMAQKETLFRKFRLAPKEKKSGNIPLKNASYRIVESDYKVN